jgi:hypothetical protein
VSKIVPENFSAWLNVQPGGPHTFHVKGMIEVNTGGWTATLTPTIPQGINPLIKLLDLVLTPPAGPVSEVISTIEATYDENPALHEYKQVQFRLAGEFTIDVKVVR